MINPENAPIDVADQRVWLKELKASSGMSWSELGKKIGVPQGTLSAWGGETYAGDVERVAREVFRYRQHVAMQTNLQVEAPSVPGYFETQTSRQITQLLAWAQRGRITVVATGPGTGKTMTVRHYRDSVPNVWLATMSPSTRGVNNMQVEVLAALGERDARGTPQSLSRRIRDRVENTGGLLAVDEAQHLSEQAVEELRSWHDATGIGIALLGNETVISRLEGGSRKVAYAQLFSRVGMRLTNRNVPLIADADAVAQAWGIENEDLVAYVRSIALKPGGLRGLTMTLELASMIASAEGVGLSVAHMQDAWSQLASRPVSL